MNPFSFVAVFFSVVIGVAVAHMLGSVSDLVEARGRVRADRVHAAWSIFVFLLLINAWWGIWDLQEANTSWHLAHFLLVVGNLCAKYMLSALIMPGRNSGETDLRQHFESVRGIFFLMLAAVMFSSATMNVSLFRTPALSFFTLLPATMGLLALIAVRPLGRLADYALAAAYLISTVVFMALDTTRLT